MMRCWHEPRVCDQAFAIPIVRAEKYKCDNHRFQNERDKELFEEAMYEYESHKIAIKELEEKYSKLLHGSSSEVPKDLEEASDEYAEKHGFRVPYDGSENFYDDVDVKASKEGFVAGAKWQKEQMMRERQHDEFKTNVEQEFLNLNSYEYIVKCALDGVTRLGSLCDDKAIIDAAKLCVEKLNEQMMKGAVEGFIFQSEDYYPKELIANYNGELKHGDKVRIIIVNPE